MKSTKMSASVIPMMWFAAFFAVGIIAGYFIGDYVKPIEWGVLVLSTCVAACYITGHPMLSSRLIYLIVFYLGAFAVSYSVSSSKPRYHDTRRLYEGVILSEPVARGKVYKCDVLITKGWSSAPAKIKASFLKDTAALRPPFDVGSAVRFESRLQDPSLTDYHPNSHFNYPLWLQIHGYKALAFIGHGQWQHCDIDSVALPPFDAVMLRLQMMRGRLLDEVRSMGIDDEAFAIVAAMGLGNKTWLQQDTRDLFSNVGASHVLALSGMHIGIIVYLLTFFLGRRRRSKMRLFVLLTIWLYVLFVGMPISAVRAAIMLTLYSLMNMTGRPQYPQNVLGGAALIILMCSPLSLFDVGFQMSFMAVFFIVTFVPYIQRKNPFAKKKASLVYEERTMKETVLTSLWSLLWVTILAQVGTAPVVAYYFGNVSLCFLLTNILVIPLATVIIYLTLLLCLSVVVGVGASLVIYLINGVVGVLLAGLSLIGSIPGAYFTGVNINIVQVCMLYVIMLCVFGIIRILDYKLPKQWDIY